MCKALFSKGAHGPQVGALALMHAVLELAARVGAGLWRAANPSLPGPGQALTTALAKQRGIARNKR